MTAPRPLSPAQAVEKLNEATFLLHRIIAGCETSDNARIAEDLFDEAYDWLEEQGAAPEYVLTALGAQRLELDQMERQLAQLRSGDA